MGALPGEQQQISVMQALLNVADRAGVKMYVPGDVAGKLLRRAILLKGLETAHSVAINRTVESFFRWSREGKLPIVIDTSPCTYGLKTARPYLSRENQIKFAALTILDSVEFVHDQLLHKLPIHRKVHSVAVHPVCSAVKMAITPKLGAHLKRMQRFCVCAAGRGMLRVCW